MIDCCFFGNTHCILFYCHYYFLSATRTHEIHFASKNMIQPTNQSTNQSITYAQHNTKQHNTIIIAGLAIDHENGWICHLSYTHKVSVAWEGRHRVPRPRLMAEYTGKRALSPSARKKRLKPLNDLFSMAECCLMADTVQFFIDRNIPFCPRSAVNDVLGSITNTHISGEFHRAVAREPERYFEGKPYLKGVLDNLRKSEKRLILVR